MKVYNILIIFMLFIVLFNIQSVKAEIISTTDTTINNVSSTVTFHNYIQLEDASSYNPSIMDYLVLVIPNTAQFFKSDDLILSKFTPTPIILNYEVEPLPYNITNFTHGLFSNALVDWCNLTIKLQSNEYDRTSGFIKNTTTTTTNYYFQNTPLSTDRLTFNLYEKDSLISDMVCHYTDQNSLFIDSVLIGRVTTYFSAYQCKNCDFNLEQATNYQETLSDSLNNEVSYIDTIQRVLTFYIKIIDIIYWLSIFISLLFVFYIIIYLARIYYSTLKEVAKNV